MLNYLFLGVGFFFVKTFIKLVIQYYKRNCLKLFQLLRNFLNYIKIILIKNRVRKIKSVSKHRLGVKIDN